MALVIDDKPYSKATDPEQWKRETVRYKKWKKEQKKKPIEEKPEEYTPAQIYIKSKLEEIRTRQQFGLWRGSAYQRLGHIDPSETYYIPMRGGVQHRVVTGAELQDIFRQDIETGETGYREYWRGASEFQETMKTGARIWHPGTRIVKTDVGYEIKFPYAGAEKYAVYKKELKEKGLLGEVTLALTPEGMFGIPAFVETTRGKPEKALDIKLQAIHRIKTLESPLDYAGWYLESPLSLPAYIGIGMATGGGMGFAAGKLALRPVTSAVLTKILPTVVGGAFITKAGFDIKTTFERGEWGRGFGEITGLGTKIAAMGIGYRMGTRVTIKGATPYEVGYTKALKPGVKIDTSKLPVFKQMQAFKAYHLDVRLARGMTFGYHPSYGKLPGFIGRRPYGADTYTSTLQQMKGTLVRTGWRGADPLKTVAWEQYYALNIQPTLAPRILTAMKYRFEPTGRVSISPVYDIKLKMPPLATGEMPLAFRTAQIPIKISGYPRTGKLIPAERVLPVISEKTITPATFKGMTFQQKIFPRGYTMKELEYLEFLETPYKRIVMPTTTQLLYRPTQPIRFIYPRATGLISPVKLPTYSLAPMLGITTIGKLPSFFKKSKIGTKTYRYVYQPSITTPVSLVGTTTIPLMATATIQKTLQIPITTPRHTQQIMREMQPREMITILPTDFFKPKARVMFPGMPLLPKPPLGGRGALGWLSGRDLPKYLFREHKLPTLPKILEKVKW